MAELMNAAKTRTAFAGLAGLQPGSSAGLAGLQPGMSATNNTGRLAVLQPSSSEQDTTLEPGDPRE
jgi:hypothetical protein